MRYDDARRWMRSGDLVLFRGQGLGAWVIRRWTRSRYAHVAVVWRIGTRVLLLESRVRTRGVAIGRPLSSALEDGAAWVPTNATWGDVPEKVALDRSLGQPYGWVDALRAAFGLRPTSRGLQCAEFAQEVLQAAGVQLRIVAPTPEALAEALPEPMPLEG